MVHEPTRSSGRTYRCLGVGVGPANLSLASLLHNRPDVTNLFLDRKPSFSWHDGQQLPGNTLQVSLFKDLVTLSDPTKPVLVPVVPARQRPAVPLPERPVRRRAPAGVPQLPGVGGPSQQEHRLRRDRAEVTFDDVFTIRTDRRTVTADNVVVGVGSRPWVPPYVRDHLGPTQFHVSAVPRRGRGPGNKRVVRDRRRAVRGRGVPRPDLAAGRPAAAPRVVAVPAAQLLPDRRLAVHQRLLHAVVRGLLLHPQPRRRASPSTGRTSSPATASRSTTLKRDLPARLYRPVHGAATSTWSGLYPNREVTEVANGLYGAGSDGPAQRPARIHRGLRGGRRDLGDGLPAGPDGLPGPDRRTASSATATSSASTRTIAVHWDGPEDRRMFVQNAARGQRGLADPNLSLNAWRSQRIADRLAQVSSERAAPLVHRVVEQATAEARLPVTADRMPTAPSWSAPASSAASSRGRSWPPTPRASVTVIDRDLIASGASRRSAGLHFPRGASRAVRALAGRKPAVLRRTRRRTTRVADPCAAHDRRRAGEHRGEAAQRSTCRRRTCDASPRSRTASPCRTARSPGPGTAASTPMSPRSPRPSPPSCGRRSSSWRACTVTGVSSDADGVRLVAGNRGHASPPSGRCSRPGPWLAAKAWRTWWSPSGRG